jgi:hypothetical protein
MSPVLFLVTSQHNIPHTSLDIDDVGVHGSTPSLAERGAMEVFFNSGLVLQICGGGLKWRRYITMLFDSFYPCN